ncbi:nicotinate-nucleotide--dimethylbenzimidazole phosphoribosyltransferase [Halorarius halobius]|uniref:nicotinate-nucleotide--dimethylbenzimidazole phosphoribosyltransferase n=1 Tax=Halorarius halobius TaxID=2962671 RepID=UPI0020CBEF15|nr:nicotinate-nucleotide--dimethylbenzimidazole phosphoribosyltransferase [Halorarius halobius]
MAERPPTSPAPTAVLVGGTTETATIPGISAAGADPGVMAHTPSADLEIVAYGRPTRAPVVPVSPTGCPTPAVVSRAVGTVCDVETVAVDAGLARPTGAPTVDVDADPGGDVRDAEPVADARDTFETAREFGASLPADELLVGETIPGGTTTALGVLTVLGERRSVSSSLPDNPLARKREVVATGLDASGLAPGDCAGDPVAAVRLMGDPVLAAVAGLAEGATASGTAVTLAGGTQLAAAAALARHAGVGASLELATTSFVAGDPSAEMRALAADLDLALTVTDPGFDGHDHPATDGFVRGEAKEGVGMGGLLALADRAGVPMADVRDRTVAVYDRLLATADTQP